MSEQPSRCCRERKTHESRLLHLYRAYTASRQQQAGASHSLKQPAELKQVTTPAMFEHSPPSYDSAIDLTQSASSREAHRQPSQPWADEAIVISASSQKSDATTTEEEELDPFEAQIMQEALQFVQRQRMRGPLA